MRGKDEGSGSLCSHVDLEARWPRPSNAGYPRACERSSGGAVFADWAAVDRGSVRMRTPMSCKLVGRWPIVEADIWDRQYLDLCGPATIVIRANGRGEIAFGALQAGLDIEYSRASVGFTWEGFDEMDEVSGDGSDELLDDGSIEIEFAYRNGDEAVLKARRNTSSTAC
jgi:hypothetical protein